MKVILLTRWKKVSPQSWAPVSRVVQDYTITMYLNQYWKDERLAFSNEEEILTLSGDFAEKIWVPDTFFANDKNRYVILVLIDFRTNNYVIWFSNYIFRRKIRLTIKNICEKYSFLVSQYYEY